MVIGTNLNYNVECREIIVVITILGQFQILSLYMVFSWFFGTEFENWPNQHGKPGKPQANPRQTPGKSQTTRTCET
jgi:hypothetical protein